VRHIAILTVVIMTAVVLSLPSTARTGGFGIDEIITITKELGKQLEWPADKTGALLTNLNKAMEDDWYKKEVEKKTVTAVFVYRATEAGLLLKVMRGNGLVTFKDGRKAAEFSIKSTSFGAHIGGSVEWAIGLVMGPADPSNFGGDYSGRMRRATAIDSNSSDGVVLIPSDSIEGKNTRQIFLVVSGRGLSAGTGGAKLTITPSW
jgi:hypothetical protein